MDKSFHITTFGCQMNEHDSETIAGMLTELGCRQTEERKEADIAIINTCSVRENADKRFFGTLGQLKRKKAADPAFIVCVCGCMMQQQHVVDTIKTKYPWVDIIFGTHNIHEFPRLLESVITEKQKIAAVLEDGGAIVEGLPAKRLYEHKAFVSIMYGCNNFCTYCIVPYTRGRERSRRPEEILREARRLVADGVREITLLGQNVNSYRGVSAADAAALHANTADAAANRPAFSSNPAGEYLDFPALLRRLNEVEGLERIRFMTSHPKDLSEDLIRAYADCEKLCNSIHLPVQSGSTAVLRRMNRKYTKEDYLTLIEKLRQAVPDITISTDIIVGFPGETEADFAETLDLCRRVQFDSAFTFLYSLRKGTPAEKYPDQIPEAVKHERFNRLVELINETSAAKNKACEGKAYPVLVEGVSKERNKLVLRPGQIALSGRTPGFKLVNFPGTEELVGRIIDVRITAGKTFSLEGELL